MVSIVYEIKHTRRVTNLHFLIYFQELVRNSQLFLTNVFKNDIESLIFAKVFKIEHNFYLLHTYNYSPLLCIGFPLSKFFLSNKQDFLKFFCISDFLNFKVLLCGSALSEYYS